MFMKATGLSFCELMCFLNSCIRNVFSKQDTCIIYITAYVYVHMAHADIIWDRGDKRENWFNTQYQLTFM